MTSITSQHRNAFPLRANRALVIGIPLAFLSGLWVLLATSGRIDSPEEFDAALRLSWAHAAPLAFASIFLTFGFTRRLRLFTRLSATGIAAVLIWFATSQFVRQSHYAHLRARGVDPERVLRSVRPQ